MNKNKIALITGATSGIGESTSYELSDQFSLILCGRNKKKLNELSNSLSKKTDVMTLEFDVRDKKDVREKISSLSDDWKNIDILINNAGNAHGLDFIYEGEIEDWDMMIDTNVKGLLYVSKYVLDFMIKKNSGHIINIGSIAGKEVYPKGNIYCASKFAVDAISSGMRIDLNKHNIKVSQINPGLVETNFSMVRFKDDQKRSNLVYSGLNPLVGEDIAKVISYVINCPENVNISDITVLAKSQASSTVLNRK
ncbi:MAG: SDR family NAD(P)-dependent oxidoreductase [Candidatus Marisimplicoccus sp.]|tara:strand:+ start:1998 stop:2753 length:756 start_codon:yes stop_codon:yes gene_type:complete